MSDKFIQDSRPDYEEAYSDACKRIRELEAQLEHQKKQADLCRKEALDALQENGVLKFQAALSKTVQERQAAAIQAACEALEFAVLHTETSGYDYALPHVARRCQDAIAQLKPCLDGVTFETWTDEQGTEWNRPTAWAYAKACKALHKHAADAAQLAEALREIMALDFAKDENGRDDFHSGAPRFVSAWLKAEAALAKLREVQGA